MTLLQRDRGKFEKGATLAVKIIKMANKGDTPKLIAEKLHIDLSYVN